MVLIPLNTFTSRVEYTGNTDFKIIVIQSDNYVAGVSGFKIDPTGNTAAFHDIDMTFSSGGKASAQTALNFTDGADVTGANTALNTTNVSINMGH